MKIFLIFSLIIYVIFSSYVEFKLLKYKLLGRKQKISQSFLIWLIPFFGAFLVNWLLNYKSPEGARPNKEPSWKRLVKYEDNGFG